MRISAPFHRALACTIVGCAIGAVVAGAAGTPEHPQSIRLGEIGTIRNQNDMVVFRFQGRDYVLRYQEWGQPVQSGRVRYTGSVYGHVLDKKLNEEKAEDGKGSRGRTPPTPSAGERKDTRGPRASR
jgi:hypothetical protein